MNAKIEHVGSTFAIATTFSQDMKYKRYVLSGFHTGGGKGPPHTHNVTVCILYYTSVLIIYARHMQG